MCTHVHIKDTVQGLEVEVAMMAGAAIGDSLEKSFVTVQPRPWGQPYSITETHRATEIGSETQGGGIGRVGGRGI